MKTRILKLKIAPDRQNLSATSVISDLRNSVGLPLCHADAFRQRVPFSLVLSFGQAKERTLAPDRQYELYLFTPKNTAFYKATDHKKKTTFTSDLPPMEGENKQHKKGATI